MKLDKVKDILKIISIIIATVASVIAIIAFLGQDKARLEVVAESNKYETRPNILSSDDTLSIVFIDDGLQDLGLRELGLFEEIAFAVGGTEKVVEWDTQIEKQFSDTLLAQEIYLKDSWIQRFNVNKRRYNKYSIIEIKNTGKLEATKSKLRFGQKCYYRIEKENDQVFEDYSNGIIELEDIYPEEEVKIYIWHNTVPYEGVTLTYTGSSEKIKLTEHAGSYIKIPTIVAIIIGSVFFAGFTNLLSYFIDTKKKRKTNLKSID